MPLEIKLDEIRTFKTFPPHHILQRVHRIGFHSRIGSWVPVRRKNTAVCPFHQEADFSFFLSEQSLREPHLAIRYNHLA